MRNGGNSDSSSNWQYHVPKESSLAWFIAISLILFTSALFLSAWLPRGAELPPLIEVDLGIEGVENEPPPLGEPDAGAGEQLTEPEKPPEMQQPEPAPVPEPIPEEPVVEQPPQPDPAPSFVVPEEVPPPPAPSPVAKAVVKPAKPVAPAPRPQSSAPADSDVAGAKAGVRGSPIGQPGGRGGGRADFISMPHPQYDATARQRGYKGRGMFLITYQDGRIVSVTTSQSTGTPYLDARTVAWVKSRFRVKSGASGSARFPIVWQLK